jgi:hypothetical protein
VFKLEAARERPPGLGVSLPVWAYRFRLNGRGSKRPQVGGFASRAEAERALRKELSRLRPGGPACSARKALSSFPAPRGGHIELHTFRGRCWRRAQIAAGIEPIRCRYDLRHTYATFALRAGVAAELIGGGRVAMPMIPRSASGLTTESDRSRGGSR